MDLEVHQMRKNIKTAFLNGNLDDEIYMVQPEGLLKAEPFNLEAGQCYSFNGEDETSVRNAIGTGENYGLQVRGYVNQSDYIEFMTGSGLVAYIRNAGVPFIPDMAPFYVSQGMAWTVYIKIDSTRHKSRRDKKCIDNSFPEKYLYNGTYTTNACERSVKQWAVIDRCGCGYPPLPVPSGVKHCDVDSYRCVAKEMEYAVVTEAKCPLPCRTDEFTVAVVPTAYPAKRHTNATCRNDQNCRKDFARNHIKINFVMLSLNRKIWNEETSYTAARFISDIGSSLAVFFGISAVSLVELSLLPVTCCQRQRTK